MLPYPIIKKKNRNCNQKCRTSGFYYEIYKVRHFRVWNKSKSQHRTYVHLITKIYEYVGKNVKFYAVNVSTLHEKKRCG